MKSFAMILILTAAVLCSCGTKTVKDGTGTTDETTAPTSGPAAITLTEPSDGAENVEIANDLILSFVKEKFSLSACDKYFDLISDKYMPREIGFKWEGEGSEFTLSLYAGSTDAAPDIYRTTEKSIKLSGLMGRTVYYWKVTSDKGESAVSSFTTADSPRTVFIDGVTNSRDMGGLYTEDGHRLKQGIIYRTALLDKITEEGISYCRDILKIKTELDLRKSDEGNAGVSSLGADVRYINIPGGCYVGDYSIYIEEYRQSMHDILLLFADKDNFPILFHCSVGRDRTGSLAFLLEALCGVSQDDIFREYDLSFFSANGDHEPSVMHQNFFVPMFKQLKTYSGSSYSEMARSYMKSLGLTDAEIDTVRDNLLENG